MNIFSIITVEGNVHKLHKFFSITKLWRQGSYFFLFLLTVAKSFLLFRPNLWNPTFSCHQTSLFNKSFLFLVLSISKIVKHWTFGSTGCGTSWPWVASLQVLLPWIQSLLCLLHLLLTLSLLPMDQQFSCRVQITREMMLLVLHIICFSISSHPREMWIVWC